MHMWVQLHPEVKNAESHGVTGSCESPDIGPGIWTQMDGRTESLLSCSATSPASIPVITFPPDTWFLDAPRNIILMFVLKPYKSGVFSGFG